MTELETLKEFISYPLNSVEEIMKRFATLPNAEWRKGNGEQQQFNFVFRTETFTIFVVLNN